MQIKPLLKEKIVFELLIVLIFKRKLTKYQLEKNQSKSKSEYYDVIFFNAKDKNSFLKILKKDTV